MQTVEYENLHLLNQPLFDAYQKSFKEALERGWFILGRHVETFERAFADYLGVPYFLGVASGLDALEIPLKCWDFPTGSEVIVPSNTYIATVNAILNCGLRPIFVEPDMASYNIDTHRIEEKITSRTRAIMLVHLYGRACEMDTVMHLCQKYDLKLVEDCAQSHGATYRGKMTGSFGVGAFSFYPTKNLGALGDAGGIATMDETLYRKMKAWRNYGSNVKYKNEFIGDNSRLDEIQAGFLLEKLKSLDSINAWKKGIAGMYDAGLKADFILPTDSNPVRFLSSSKGVLCPQDSFGGREGADRTPTGEGGGNVYHIYPIRHPERDALKAYLLSYGIKTEIHYPIAPCDQKSLRDAAALGRLVLDENDFVLSRQIHATELSLPISTIHKEADIQYVIDVMNKF